MSSSRISDHLPARSLCLLLMLVLSAAAFLNSTKLCIVRDTRQDSVDMHDQHTVLPVDPGVPEKPCRRIEDMDDT